MRFRRPSAREELRDFYYACLVQYEHGYIAAKKNGGSYPTIVGHGFCGCEGSYPAFKAGHDAAKECGSSSMPPEVFGLCVVEWLR